MKELIEKLDKQKDLESRDYYNLVYDFKFYEETGEDGRWTRPMYTVAKLNDRYFEVHWQKGLTELQEDYFDEYPVEVKIADIREIKIKEYVFERI